MRTLAGWRMELRLPRLTTVTAVTNVYLLVSMLVIQTVSCSRPPHRVTSDNSQSHDIKQSKLNKRSPDSYYYYYDDYEEEFFRPSIKFESNKEPSSSHKNIYRGDNKLRQHNSYHQRYNEMKNQQIVGFYRPTCIF